MNTTAELVPVSTQAASSQLVGMGQIALIVAPEVTRAVLGSCIGLALYHPRCRTGAFAHIVLAKAAGRDGTPGKYADTAVPFLIELLQSRGVPRGGLVAKLTGGANMFANNGPLQVGRDNATAVKAELETRRIPVIAEHLGGSKGRRVVFQAEQGLLTVEIAGESPFEL